MRRVSQSRWATAGGSLKPGNPWHLQRPRPVTSCQASNRHSAWPAGCTLPGTSAVGVPASWGSVEHYRPLSSLVVVAWPHDDERTARRDERRRRRRRRRRTRWAIGQPPCPSCGDRAVRLWVTAVAMSVRRDGAGPDSAASLLMRESQARDDLERQLLCPICLEMFSKPVVILPCQHNLCRKCANDVFQSRGGGPSIGGGGRFRCPSCRHEVLLDRHGVYGLQRNLLVENIIDIYKQQQQQQQPSRGSAATGPGGRKDAEPHCAEHEEERVNIYCSSCRTPTCSLCKVFGSHQHCQVAPLGVVYEQHKGELSDGLAQVVVSSERLQEGLMELEGTLHSLDESSKLQQRVIGEAFEALSLVLEGRKRALTAAVQAQQEVRARAIRARVARLAQRVDDASKLVEAALQLLDEPGAAKFLQSATGLIVRMSEVATAVDALPAGSGVDDLGKFRVDFSREADILRRLDFVPDEVTVEEKVEEPSGAGEVKAMAQVASTAEVATAETMTVAAGAQGEASVGTGEHPKTLGPEEGPPQPGPRGTNPGPCSNPNAMDSTAIDSGERSREPEVRSYKIPSAGAEPRQDPPQPAATPGGLPRGPGVVRSAARGPPTSPSLWPGGGGVIPPRGGPSMKEERNDAGTMNGGVGGGTGSGAASRSSEGGRESLREERKDAGTTNGAGAGASTGTTAGAGVGSWWSEENPESSDGNSTFVFSFAWLNSQHK